MIWQIIRSDGSYLESKLSPLCYSQTLNDPLIDTADILAEATELLIEFLICCQIWEVR